MYRHNFLTQDISNLLEVCILSKIKRLQKMHLAHLLYTIFGIFIDIKGEGIAWAGKRISGDEDNFKGQDSAV